MSPTLTASPSLLRPAANQLLDDTVQAARAAAAGTQKGARVDQADDPAAPPEELPQLPNPP